MSPSSEPRPAEALLTEHVEWIRALARRLVGDAHEADELAQDALVVALEERPADAGRFRPWLASVLRNLLRQKHRASMRRAARELAGARRESLPSTDDLVAELATFRELAQLVGELDEPYRTAILLRFYEDLPPREIARRLGEPLATVQSRLSRGVRLLRARFAQRRGSDRAWLVALLPLVERKSALPALVIGGIVVKTKLVLAAAAVVVAALVLVLARPDAAQHSSPAVASPHADLARPSDGATLAAAETAEIANERASASPAAPAIPDSKPAAPRSVHAARGRVLGPSGEPLPGLALAWSDVDAIAGRSGALGAFDLTRISESGGLVVREDGWTTVRSGVWSVRSSIEPIVVAARAIEIGGFVRDARGEPLQGARVTLAMPRGFETRFATSLEASTSYEWHATSDAQGAFALAKAPSIPGATLKTALEGWSQAETPAPEHGDPALVITLQRPSAPLAGALKGRVVDQQGSPVVGARVFVGLASTTSDDEGRFAIDLARASTSDRALAVKGGFRPAVLERPREPRDGSTGWPDRIELVLGGPPLSIRGVVVDEKGAPREGALVWVADPTSAGSIGMMPTTLENLMAGAIVPPQALDVEANMPAKDGDNFWDHSMTSANPRPSAFWNFAKTDASGTFELGGLDDRRYSLRAMDPATLIATTTEGVRAGERAAKLSLAGPKVHARVAGRVVDDSGTPVDGVRISVVRETYGVRARVFGGRVYVTARSPRETATTDEDGRFELANVPVEGIELALKSEDIVPQPFALAADAKPLELKIEVALRCAFEVRVISPGLVADRIAVRDGDGNPLDLMRIDEEHTNAWTDVPIVDGRTGVVSASSAARVIHLLSQGQVVKTVPIRLRRGDPQTIDV